MIYPESIIEPSSLDKQIKEYRCIIEKGKDAELKLSNILHQQRIESAKSYYSEGKLRLLSGRRSRPLSSRPRATDPASASDLPKISPSKEKARRPKSASSVQVRPLIRGPHNSVFAELFSKTLDWSPLNKCKQSNKEASSDQGADDILERILLHGKTPKPRRPITANGLRSGTKLPRASPKRNRPTTASSARVPSVSAEAESRPRKERPPLLVQMDDVVMDAHRALQRKAAMRKASINRKASMQSVEDGVEDFDEVLDLDPAAVYDPEHFHTLLLWRVSLRRGADPLAVFISICVKRAHDDSIYIVASDCFPPHSTRCIRQVLVDDAWSLVEAASFMPQYASASFELSSLGELITHLCETADFSNAGFLTRDEFRRILLGLSMNLSESNADTIVQEADPTGLNVIDYSTIIPRVIEMVQAFQAKSKIEALSSQNSSMSVHHTICDSTYNNICRVCLDMFAKADPTFQGSISINVFRNRLRKAIALGLTLPEIEQLESSIPKDNRGRALYKFFRDVYYDVRFQAAKNSVIESAGSDLQKFILDLLSHEDIQYSHEVGKLPDGRVPLANVMSRLSLSRAQVLILCSDPPTIDGLVSVYDFAPILASVLEIMLNSHDSKVKSDLVKYIKSDLGSLQEEDTLIDLQQRLENLFQITDRDKSGELDRGEFENCLIDLNVGLKQGEISALFLMADTDNSGYISLEEFKSFCLNALVGVIKEKKIMIQSYQKLNALAASASEAEKKRSTDKFLANLGDYRDLLKNVYNSIDKLNDGLILFHQYDEVLRGLHLDLSSILLDTILSEIDPREGVRTDFHKVLDMQTQLLHAFRAITPSSEPVFDTLPTLNLARKYMEKLYQGEVNYVSKIILNKLRIEDQRTMRAVLGHTLRSPFCNMSRCASNYIISHLWHVSHDHVILSPIVAEVCSEAIAMGIVRDLMCHLNPNLLFKSLLHACEVEAQQLHGTKYVDESNSSLPIRSCIRLLHDFRDASFRQSDILSVLIQCEQSVKDKHQIQYMEFAKIAIEHIVYRCSDRYYETIIRFNEYSDVDDDILMHGLTKYHLMDHLRSSFSHCEDAVPEKVFADILLLVPSVHLKSYEANVLVSFCEIDERGFVYWKDFIFYSFAILYSLFREKYLIRRLPLFQLQDNLLKRSRDEALEPGPADVLAEKVLGIVKIEIVSNDIIINLPNIIPLSEEKKDKRKANMRRNSIPKGFNREIEVEKSIPVLGYDSFESIDSKIIITIYQKTWGGKNEVCLSLLEDSVSEIGQVKAIALKLPSLAVVEESAAEEFALRAIETIRIEFGKNGAHLVLGA